MSTFDFKLNEYDQAAQSNSPFNAGYPAARRSLVGHIAELEQQLAAARELLREIRDGEVNAEDEADKFLRDHVPSELKKVKADLEAARKDAERWRKNIEMIRRKNGGSVTQEIIDTVDAAIEASKAGVA